MSDVAKVPYELIFSIEETEHNIAIKQKGLPIHILAWPRLRYKYETNGNISYMEFVLVDYNEHGSAICESGIAYILYPGNNYTHAIRSNADIVVESKKSNGRHRKTLEAKPIIDVDFSIERSKITNYRNCFTREYMRYREANR